MTTTPKTPTHRDGDYRFYLDSKTIHAWHLGYKKLGTRFLMLLGLICVLYTFDLYHAYTRIIRCERISIEQPVHCTITHHHFTQEKLIASIDVIGIKISERNSYITLGNQQHGDELFRYTYTLVQQGGLAEHELIARKKADKETFKSQLETLIAINHNDKLPQHIEISSSSFELPYVRLRHGLYDIILFLFAAFSFVIYINQGLGVRKFIANKQNGIITLENNKKYLIQNIDFIEIILKNNNSHLIIHILDSKHPIKIIGKNKRLHQHIKSTLEQWIIEAKKSSDKKGTHHESI